jgi:hypothetical protein
LIAGKRSPVAESVRQDNVPLTAGLAIYKRADNDFKPFREAITLFADP